MRVPVRRLPQTRVSEQQQGFARPVQPLDVEPIINLAEGLRDQILDEQDARQRVELNRRLLREANELQADFEERRRDPEQSPIDFADNTETAYAERHAALIGELRNEGFSQDLLDEFDGRLGAARAGLYVRGLDHQLTQLRARAAERIEDAGTQGSQLVAANPDNYPSARDTLIESIETDPDLLESERAAAMDEQLALLRAAGAEALRLRNPQFIVDALDPHGFTAPGQATAPSGGAAGATPTAAVTASGAAAPYAQALTSEGLPPAVVAGFLGNIEVESGFRPRSGDTDGNSHGAIQWRGPRVTNFQRVIGVHPNQATPAQTARFIKWEMDNPTHPSVGMTVEQRDAILAARTPQEAAELIDRFYERSTGEARAARAAAAGRYMGTATQASAPAPVQTASVVPIDIPASTAPQQSDFTEPALIGEEPTPDEQARAAGVPQATDISSVRTGHPLLDDLNGRERLQLLTLAREQLTRVTATQRAEMDVAVGNIIAERMNGEAGTPLPAEEDVLRVYGPVEGPQRMAQLRAAEAARPAIIAFRTQSETEIAASLAALAPVPGSPTYATQQEIYAAAERAANALRAERAADPAAYAMRHFPSVRAARSTGSYYAELDRVYEQLGIDSRTAPVLSAEATRQITEQYRFMNPNQRREFLVQHMGEMGEDRFRRFVADMEGTTAETDARIFALLRTYVVPRGPITNLFHQILEGRETIATDPARRPPADQVLSLFRDNVGDAIRHMDPDTSRAMQEAAEALYVQRGGDPRDVAGNSRLYRQVLAEVLGGSLPVDMRHGQVRDMTILPPGVNEQQFQNWIERQTMETLTRSSVAQRAPRYGSQRAVPMRDIINEGTFVMVAPGQYMILMGSDGRPIVTSPNRRGQIQPFIVNVNTRDVVRTSAPPPRVTSLRRGAM